MPTNSLLEAPSFRVGSPQFTDDNEKGYYIFACLDNEGYASIKGRVLIEQLGGKATTVDEAIEESKNWKTVKTIQVTMDGLYPRITGFVFKEVYNV